MSRLKPSLPWIRRGAGLAAAGIVVSASLVGAQPAPSTTPAPAPSAPVPPAPAPGPATPSPAPIPPPPGPAPGAPIAEEAPPIVVAPPTPIIVPPIAAAEVTAVPEEADREAAEKAPEAPVRRARYDVAVIQAIDKVTAETLRFEAAVGRPVRYKSLVFTVRACERSAPDEAVEDSIVYLTIQSQPRPAPGKPTPPPRQAFRGWMFAASPGLHPLEHPVYDAWLITCRAASPPAVASR